MKSAVEVKADILSKGVKLSPSLLENYTLPFLEKRRAYGNPDPENLRKERIPQELYISPENERLISAVNVNMDSDWLLDYDEGDYLLKNGHEEHTVSFPIRPEFYGYDLNLKNRAVNLSSVATLYGGESLGIFAYGTCQLVEIGEPCHYCSIQQNREKEAKKFAYTISEEVMYHAVKNALKDAKANLSQVMLNGGNFPDMDKSFLHYVKLAKAAFKAIEESGREVELHLIVYPPKDLNLIEELRGLDVSIAMNTEIFDPVLFEKYCPGKVKTAGREHILSALDKAVEVLDKGNVFSILVGGLEPIESLSKGLHHLASRGITPVINVLHTDPGTPLENFPNPTPEFIKSMGIELQKVYDKYELSPFYMNCGRNSIDTEAFKKLFIHEN